MAISIQISGESAKEVKELVGDLASVVFGIKDLSFPQTTVVSTIDEPETTKKEVKQTTASKEDPKHEESVTSITIEELRALAQEKNKAVGSAAVREVLGKYGGLPKAKPEQYGQIKQELESL